MAGLTERAAGSGQASPAAAAEAQRNWEATLLAQMDRLRAELRRLHAGTVVASVGGSLQDGDLVLRYWGRQVLVSWPDLDVSWHDGRSACPPFDAAMVLYHLHASDGTPAAGSWISFRDLPGASFYHQAFSGYTGRRLAATYGSSPADFDEAARRLGGETIRELAPSAWRFLPFERVPLGACLWPGDDELPAQATVVFDAHAGRHLPTDGLALLGSGLTGRLLRAAVVAT
jgi:hypothetical protein